MRTSTQFRMRQAPQGSGWLGILPGRDWGPLPASSAAASLPMVYWQKHSVWQEDRASQADGKESAMQSPALAEPTRPKLDELGVDLLETTPWQRRIALARPFIGVAAYIVVAMLGFWWLTPLIVFLIFVAVVTVAHDVVHSVLGLSRRQTDWALFFTG